MICILYVLPSAKHRSGYKVAIKYILNEEREEREWLFFTLPSQKEKKGWSASLAFVAS